MSKKTKKSSPSAEDKKFPLPKYPAKDDIYNKAEEEPLDEENVKGQKKPGTLEDNDLDIPGSELDDENEAIGEEDEENNYYSLGGDNHEDLEEDKA